MSASFRFNLLFAWLRLCQDQSTCAQPEALALTNLPAVTKKSKVAVVIFNDLILKIHMNYFGALPQTLICFQALFEFNRYKSVYFKNAFDENRAIRTLPTHDKLDGHLGLCSPTHTIVFNRLCLNKSKFLLKVIL